MKYLLAARNRPALVSLLREKPLLAFDYDGTLAPLTPDRDQAFMRPGTRDLFRSVATLHACAVITGRSRSDMMGRVAGVPLVEVIGNHGMEPSDNEVSFERITQSWVPRVESAVRRIPGAELENKRLSLSVHYWKSRTPNVALAEILSAVQQLGDEVHIVRGHSIVNLLPRGARMKSGAVTRLMRNLGRRRALFAGDDWTDEEAFQTLDAAAVMTIRIGRFARSRAGYFLRSQREIDDLLETIRTASSSGRWEEPAEHFPSGGPDA